MRKVGIFVAAVVLSAIVGAPAAGAAPKGKEPVWGTIDLATAEVEYAGDLALAGLAQIGPSYGDYAQFDVTVGGDTARKSRVYVTVVCFQGPTVVFQYSGSPDFEFPLHDQLGQGLDWDGGDAICQASLMYRVEKGRGYTLTNLGTDTFNVYGS